MTSYQKYARRPYSKGIHVNKDVDDNLVAFISVEPSETNV